MGLKKNKGNSTLPCRISRKAIIFRNNITQLPIHDRTKRKKEGRKESSSSLRKQVREYSLSFICRNRSHEKIDLVKQEKLPTQ
jgi:hypothetical protein